ncbi:MAG: hypothetical protein JWP13_609 [Candidatus Saccharibacteria bacterium]|nr:hypothetical protein [Candidatus Saccharibacteria bacterium]
MNKTVVYQLQGFGGVIAHFPIFPTFVRDIEEDAEILRQARIRSGDYLTTLATELEQIAESLDAAKAPEAPALERIVSELIYVDRNYSITPRK